MSNRQSSLKDDALCPRCGSSNIKSGAKIEGKEGLHSSNRIPVDSKISVELDNYVCVDCGYTESYIADRGMLNRIERLWQKVDPEKDDS